MRPHSASHAAKAKNESKFKRKDKKMRSTLSGALHSFAIQGSIIAMLQIAFIVCFIFILKNNALKVDKWGKPFIIAMIFSFFVLVDSVFIMIHLSNLRKVSHQTDVDVASIIGQDIKEAYDFSKLGLVVVDSNDIVIWVNEFLVSRQVNILDRDIYDLYSELLELKDNDTEKKEVRLKINNCTYAVEYLKDSRLFLFRDISDFVE